MQTKEQVIVEVKKDIDAVLRKWGATMSIEDHDRTSPDFGRDLRITIDVPAIWAGGQMVRDLSEVDLGKYVSIDEADHVAESQQHCAVTIRTPLESLR